MQSESLKKFLDLVSDEQPLVHERMKWLKENKEWRNVAVKVIMNVLGVMRERKITQEDLAERLEVTPQWLNTVLRGNEKLTLEIIGRFEKVLQIEIIEANPLKEKKNKYYQNDTILFE